MKLIAVWGSSGAGKTTVSLALAAVLSKNEDVLVISTEDRSPALPVYLPSVNNLNTNNSIGSLLDIPENISESSLKGRLHQHPKHSRLFFAGYVTGEQPGMTYKPVSRKAAITLLQLFHQTPFAYVIVDCDSNPVYDAMTLAAMEKAQTVLRVVTPDVKGYEFQKAQLSWMGGNTALQVDRHIKIVNPVFPYTPLNDAQAVFGGFDFALPYAEQVAMRLAAGEILRNFDQRSSIDFENQIAKLAKHISEVNENGE
jgi:MinD-like ATPase involved in chromosome partitioning or flagellar assembly